MNIKEMTLYSASMNSGYSGSILYGLDAVGTVWIFLRGIKHTDGSSYTSGLDRMTIIPVGYRPKAIWAEAVSFFVDNNTCVQNVVGRIYIGSDGELRVYYYRPGDDCKAVSGMICYPAAP